MTGKEKDGHTAKAKAQDAQKQSKAVADEKNNFDPKFRPGDRDAQIDASGARFETDG